MTITIPKYQISEHYNGSVRIRFWENPIHKYQLEGRRDYLIGVTTATGMLDKSRPMILWATKLAKDYLLDMLASEEGGVTAESIEMACSLHETKREEAAETGTLTHAWAEAYIKGQNPKVPDDPKVKSGVLAFLKWVRDEGVRFVVSEKRVYSKKYEYVGTMDVVFTIKREKRKVLHVGDFKTSNGFYLDQAFQIAAYQEADTEENGTKYGEGYVIKFQKEDKFDKEGNQTATAGTFEVKSFTPEEHAIHFQGFLACLTLKKVSKVWEATHGYYSKK